MCSKLGCSFSSFLSSSCRENRYLLFLTENYAALQILKRYLQEKVGQSAARSGKYVSVGGARGLESPWDWVRKNRSRQKEPLLLFGSSFPKDKTYTQVCVCSCIYLFSQCTCICMCLGHSQSVQVSRIINQIKICMETGCTVILLNLENLYESLYDLLNQVHIPQLVGLLVTLFFISMFSTTSCLVVIDTWTWVCRATI